MTDLDTGAPKFSQDEVDRIVQQRVARFLRAVETQRRELQRLRAEVAELRAALADGGTRAELTELRRTNTKG
jgi:hypothetical protein